MTVYLIGLFFSLIRPPVAVLHANTARRTAVRLADDTPPADGDLVSPSDMARLRSRISRIQEEGLATPAQKLFDLAMATPPQALMVEFFRTSPAAVTQAMQEAVMALLGALPPLEFDSQVTTTGDKLAALMLQLQMTGYMLRNAEYVMALRSVLQLSTRSLKEYREAFERLDLDGSGFIEVAEVREMLSSVYNGDVPPHEVNTMMSLFDTDGDGKISWDEFAAALGAQEGSTVSSARSLLAGTDGAAPSPKISGNVTVTMDDGSKVEMDATAYMEQLQLEAQNLKAELGQVESKRVEEAAALSTSLSAYVASLPEDQLKLLTTGISDDVVSAMRQLVTYILRSPSGDAPLGKEQAVTMEQNRLQQLCLYQLVLGYKLREAEATGEAQDAIGR